MERDKMKIAAAPFRLSWSALFGGMFAAAGVWLLLHVLGLALGFSQLEPDDPSDLRATGIGGGIWTVVSGMVALFVGGVVTTRAAGLLGRSNAALHGIVLWGATTLGGAALIVTIIASLARGVSGVTVETISMRAMPSPAGQLGYDEEALLTGINDRLTAMNRAPLTSDQLAAAVRDAGQNAWRGNRFERSLFVDNLARYTGLAPAEVDNQLGRPAPDKKSAGERVARVTGGAFWALFGAMLLSLASAVLGAVAGLTRRQRELSAQAAHAPLPPLSVPITGVHGHT